MKKYSLFSIVLLMTGILFITSCQKDEITQPVTDEILPENFKVDLPVSLSYESLSLKSANVDTLKGNEVYQHLGNFIHIGEKGAENIQDVIRTIRVFHINKPISFSYESDDDGRTKNLVVTRGQEYDGINWEFKAAITDAESEGNADGGKAIQVFWNRNPVKGIALMKPYNIDRRENIDNVDAMFRVDYSEAREHGYDAEMIVYAAYLKVADPLDNPYSMSSMKMFAGRKGNITDVYGNSDHPNAILLAGNAGFDWAFIASGDNNTNLGVAEVGLPPTNLDEPSRRVLLGYYSLQNVLTREIYAVWPDIDEESVQAYLYNTSAPGYFDTEGFVSGGAAPGAGYELIEPRLKRLSPYNPKEITTLQIQFQ